MRSDLVQTRLLCASTGGAVDLTDVAAISTSYSHSRCTQSWGPHPNEVSLAYGGQWNDRSQPSFTAAIILEATLLMLLTLSLDFLLCRFTGSDAVLIGRPLFVACIGK